MTTDLSPSGIQHLLEICQRATEGPWQSGYLTENRMVPNSPVFDCVSNRHGQVLFRAHRVAEQAEYDAVCIATARTALPDALAAVERVTADCCSLQSQLDAANEGAWEYERQLNAALKCLQEIADMHVGDQPAALAHYSEADWVKRHVGVIRHLAGEAVKKIVADEGAKPKPIETAYDIISAGLSDGTCAANIVDKLVEAEHLRAGAPMTAPTPTIDKAVVEVLDSDEIRAALRELKAIDPDGTEYGLQICARGACVISGQWQTPARWLPSAEDALIAKRADLLEIIAEIETGS